MDCKVVNSVLKFADDSKLYGPVSSSVEIDSLRQDLKTLCDWSEDWLMLFNIDKCKVVHFGTNNPLCTYSMNNNVLSVVEEEKDLGIIVQNNLKVSSQCVQVVKTANKILGVIQEDL